MAPEVRFWSAILHFLGYDPRPEPEGFGGRIRAAREADGLSEELLARKLRLDPGTVGAWDREEVHRPYPRIRRLFERYLAPGGPGGTVRYGKPPGNEKKKRGPPGRPVRRRGRPEGRNGAGDYGEPAVTRRRSAAAGRFAEFELGRMAPRPEPGDFCESRWPEARASRSPSRYNVMGGRA